MAIRLGIIFATIFASRQSRTNITVPIMTLKFMAKLISLTLKRPTRAITMNTTAPSIMTFIPFIFEPPFLKIKSTIILI